MKTVVVDSSVVAKWFLPEPDSEKARELISAASTGTMEVVVLDLALVEVANAIWKRRRLSLSTTEEARASVESLLAGPMRVENSSGVLRKGFEIAMKYDRAVYDALFVAMARELKVSGVTADEPLYHAVRQDFPEIKLLRMWVPSSGEKDPGQRYKRGARLYSRAVERSIAIPGMTRVTAILLMVASCAAAAATTTNSADLYGRAFEKIREDQRDLSPIDDVGTTPMNEATGKFLSDRADVVAMLRDAAKIPAADWGPSGGDLPAALKPLNSARSASSLLLLQARYDLHENKPDQAVDDTLAAIAVGRNIARQQKFVSTLVDIGIEWQAIDALGAELVVLPKQTVAALPAKITALPPPLSGKELMDGEFAFGRQVWDKQNMPMPIFDAAKPFYKAVGDAMDQPQAKFEQTVDAEATKLMLNPVVKNIESTVKRIHVTLLAMTAKRAMLGTAIDVVLNGEGAVAKSKDPGGDGPFGLSGSATHFTLTSKAVDSRDKPVTLRVGG